MVKCEPCCGMGVRHLQYLLLATMNCLDFWIQALNVAIYVEIDILKMTPEQKTMMRLSAFVFYTVGRFVSSFVVLRVSNKYTLLCFIVLETAGGAVMVWFVHLLGITVTGVLLVIIAFLRSFHATFMYNILSKWMPPSDYTTAFCIITVIKDMFSFMLSSQTHGVSLVHAMIAFQMITVCYLSWCVLFLVFGAESPQTSFLISKQEWNYLSKAIGPRKKIHCKAKTPWLSILKTFILYIFILFDFGKESNGSVIAKAVNTIVNTTNVTGTTMLVMQSLLMLFSFGLIITCVFVDRGIAKEKLEPGPTRKVMTTLGCSGVAISMILTAYVDAHMVKISYLFIAHCFFMIVHTFEPTLLFELSPNYACVIYGATSFIRNWMILIQMKTDPEMRHFDLNLKGPNVTTHIGKDVPDGLIYRYGFLIFFTNLFFVISGNVERKDFDSYETQDWRKESIISYP